MKKNWLLFVIIILIILLFSMRIMHHRSMREGFNSIGVEVGGLNDIKGGPSSVKDINPNPNIIVPSSYLPIIKNQNQKQIVIDENAIGQSIKFGPPLGDSVSVHEKINRVIDTFRDELKNLFSKIPEQYLNTPLHKLPSPVSDMLNQSVASLFPITTSAFNMPLNKFLNTNNSINQISDQLQPPQ